VPVAGKFPQTGFPRSAAVAIGEGGPTGIGGAAGWNLCAANPFHQRPKRSPVMFKYAILFLVISILAGGIGMTNISQIAKRISLVLFALFFLGFLALLGFAYLLGEAFNAGAQSMLVGGVLSV
jgi:uncharacterized membrane protein YtjA (UPF0391 family)